MILILYCVGNGNTLTNFNVFNRLMLRSMIDATCYPFIDMGGMKFTDI